MRSFLILLVSVSLLAACSSNKNKFNYAAKAGTAPSPEVPPDLTLPSANDRFSVPGKEGEKVASYSDFSRGSSSAQGAGDKVLPDSDAVRIERNGAQRWLVVKESPESLWPKLRAFWSENGFGLLVDTPESGVMETDWQEDLSTSERSMLGRLFWGASGRRDQFLVRVERSKEGKGAEVYVSHHGQQDSGEKTKEGRKWLPRPNDPELENAALQLLMGKLREAPSPAAEQTPLVVPAPQWKDGAEGKQIVLAELFDKAWRRVGLALDKARIKVEDKDRSKGIFYVRIPSKDGKNLLSYQLVVRENAGSSEIVALNGIGSSDSGSQRLLEMVYPGLDEKASARSGAGAPDDAVRPAR